MKTRTVQLGSVLLSQRGGFWGSDPGTSEIDVRVIRNGDLLDSGDIRWRDLPLRGLRHKEAEKARVVRDDIVLTTSGDCGYVAHVSEEPRVPTCATNFVRLLRTDTCQADPAYLFYFMAREQFRNSLSPFIRGTTMKNLAVSDALEGVSIPLPSLPEQLRIAEILEQADRLRRTRRYALELSDTFLPAAFLEMFCQKDSAFAPSLVEDMAVPRPGAIRTGPFGSQLLHSEFCDSGIAVLGIDNAVNNRFEWHERRFITPRKYGELKRYTVHSGDVIITIMGTCGRCAIVPDDIPAAINTKHLCCITLDQARCLPVYLHGAFLHHPHIRHQLNVATKGAIMEGLNMEIIKDLRIPFPPVPLQQRFADLVRRHEQLRATQRESLRQAEHLFQSLLHRAFAEVA